MSGDYETMSHESGGICWCAPGEPHGPDKRVSRETSAVVTRELTRSFLAWCEQHQDGIRTHRRVTAEEWAKQHNAEQHKESNE